LRTISVKNLQLFVGNFEEFLKLFQGAALVFLEDKRSNQVETNQKMLPNILVLTFKGGTKTISSISNFQKGRKSLYPIAQCTA